MKRIIYKSSIIIPLAMVFYSISVESFAFCIPAINLYMQPWSSRVLIVMMAIVWLYCSPFRHGTCNGTITELLFNIIPVEFVLLLILAQFHFVLSLLIMLLALVGEIVLFCALKKDEKKHCFSQKRHQRYKLAFRRCSIFSIAIICAIPCMISVFIYGFKSPPQYKATEELYNKLFSETNDTVEADDLDNPYEKNTELWGYLQQENWNRLTIQERITVIQGLVDFESDILGIPAVPVTAGNLGVATLGAYDNENNEMWINTQHLALSSVTDVIQTICHEIWHSMQWYLVSTIDWNNPALQTAYFKELQDWADNQKHYKSAWKYGFKEYEEQPLEVTAREYGEKETARIMTYIERSG